ncbi:MAG: hypothetical protein QNJ51_17930 [Calothrix sp. MO_167.B12]|nr:hypothetical protein [Calothrix sp. MO_167.B12]
MNIQAFLISSCSGLVVFFGQAIFFVYSGAFSIGTQISELKSDIQVLKKDISAQRELYEYKFKQLKKEKDFKAKN